ncbi:MAG: glycine cleavage system aminomethyltransferase GcvT, partial [Planctomycetota bacterium]
MKQTALHDVHAKAHEAKMVEFGGWHMPVQYGPILDEVRCVREAAGLFDLSHMGRLRLTGPDATRLADSLLTNYVAKIPVGAIRYSLFCKEDGFPIDDLLVYREEDAVYLVVNASNTGACISWVQSHMKGFDAQLEDQTEATDMLAVQGPRSLEIVTKACSDLNTKDGTLGSLGYYRFCFGTFAGIENVRISRTGYTGENGFELYFPTAESERVWKELLRLGEAEGLRPIGLGARDVLRLEAGMPLYGHEIDEAHHPLEAGLAFGVSFAEEKGDWIGREALKRFADHPTRRLVGLKTDGKRVPRQDTPVFSGETGAGKSILIDALALA